MALLDEAIEQYLEPLRKEIAEHIQTHDMYISGLRDATQFMFNELMEQLGPAERNRVKQRIVEFAALYKNHPTRMLSGEARSTEHYRRGVELVFQHALQEIGDSNPGSGPNLTVIDGGKGDDE